MPYVEFYPKPGQAVGIQVDDKPERIGLRYPVDVGLIGDTQATLRELLMYLPRNEDRTFLQTAQKGMKEWWDLTEERGTDTHKPMRPQVLSWNLGQLLEDDAILTGDSGTVTTYAARTKLQGKQKFSFSGTLCSMAAGLPDAIGAQMAFPTRQVVAFTGDGSLSMMMGDLATLAQYKLPIKILVMKNNTLGLIKWEQMIFLGNPEYGVDLAPIGFVKVAEGCGLRAVHIEDPKRCREQLEEGLNMDGPVVIEAVTDPNEPPYAAESDQEAGQEPGGSAGARGQEPRYYRVNHGARGVGRSVVSGQFLWLCGSLEGCTRDRQRERGGEVMIASDQTVSPKEGHDLAGVLRRRVDGEVRFDDGSRALYASDLSMYRQVPIGVVIPRTIDDAVETVPICRERQIPILGRGCGTSLAGQTCNVAVVIDFSKYLNKIEEVNARKKFAWVQPGVICDTLQKATKKHDLVFPPDPATHAYCPVGGMIGNNSCGAHTVWGGKTVDNVEELDILTYDGLRITVGANTEKEVERFAQKSGRKGEIYSKVLDLRDRYGDRIRSRYPHIPRRVSGYNLDSLLPEKGFHLAQALVGSESTLVLVLRAKLSLKHYPAHRVLVVVSYPDIFRAGGHGAYIRSLKPDALEIFEKQVIENQREKGKDTSARSYCRTAVHGCWWSPPAKLARKRSARREKRKRRSARTIMTTPALSS